MLKPWRETIETFKEGYTTYAKALWEYIYHENFPDSKQFQILRAKKKEKPRNLSSADFLGGKPRNTPTDHTGNTNSYLQEAADAATSPFIDNNEYEDMDDIMFYNLPTNIPDEYDWSEGFDATLTVALVNYAMEYYNNLQQRILAY